VPEIKEVTAAVAAVPSWNARVTLIRKIPEEFGVAQHQAVYAEIAKVVYVPNLAPDFAYVHWRAEYELDVVQKAYKETTLFTEAFTRVKADELADALRKEPTSLLIFRLLLGFTAQEFAAATKITAEALSSTALSSSRVKTIEGGSPARSSEAIVAASVIDRAMRQDLFGAPESELRSKIDKPDTSAGWAAVRELANKGVPLDMFLHQRHYGGAFRQLLDATSTKRGDILEDAVSELFERNRVPHIWTGSQNQEEIERRFGITIKPAPDFVVFDKAENLKAILECKGANDGGTARDKAARFRSLRSESMRLGGVPVFAVLSGLGWTRTADALGPVVRDTDGRVFTLSNLEEMLTVEPLPGLLGTA
jgi:hypothetical protein